MSFLDSFWQQRLELPLVARVHQHRLQGVVAVVTQREAIAAELDGRGVEDAAAEARAEGAIRAARLGLLRHDGVRVLTDQLKGYLLLFHPVLEASGIVTRLHLIEVDGDKIPVVKR